MIFESKRCSHTGIFNEFESIEITIGRFFTYRPLQVVNNFFVIYFIFLPDFSSRYTSLGNAVKCSLFVQLVCNRLSMLGVKMHRHWTCLKVKFLMFCSEELTSINHLRNKQYCNEHEKIFLVSMLNRKILILY